MEKHSRYSKDHVRPCAKDIASVVNMIENKSRLRAVTNKFSKPQYGEVTRKLRDIDRLNQTTVDK